MRQILHHHPLRALLLALCLTWAAAPAMAQTLQVGYRDGAGTDGVGIYNGGFTDMAPTNFYLKYSGTQIIYLKDELAPLAGKTLQKVQFPYYNEGLYGELSRHIRLYVWETDETEFRVNPDNSKKTFFPVASFQLVGEEDQDFDFYENAYEDGVLELTLQKPYVYSGEHNLVLQVVFEGDECSDATSIWFYESLLRNRAITYVSDKKTFFEKVAETTDADATLGCGTNIWLPFTTFVYDNGEASSVLTVGQTPSGSSRAYDAQGRPATTGSRLRIENGKKILK